jgi:addiction module HigA family antidote
MKPHNLSMNKRATDLRVPLTPIAEIYHERRGITNDTALRLARYLNTSAAFWVNLRWRYELEVAEDREAARIAPDVRPMEAGTSARQ